jgi:tetratricopeptide (TPR) repeat protein
MCILGAILIAGCSSPERPAAPAPAQKTVSPPAVQLPDTSRTSEVFRRQLEDRYAAVRERGDAAAYGELGKLLLSAEHIDAAEAAFLNAQALAPDDFQWPYYLGHVYNQNSDAERASAAFERALAIRANDLPTLKWLGEARLDLGQAQEAQGLFERALAIDPEANAILYGLGRAALAQQDYKRAAEALERALALDPRTSAVHYPLAMAYRGLGDTTKSESHLRARGDVEPGIPDPLMRELDGLVESGALYDLRARDALQAGDFPGAARIAREGLAVGAGRPSLEASLRHRLGTALAQMGDNRGAYEEFARAVKVYPDFPRARYSLGIMLSIAGRTQEALDELLAAVTLDPGYVEAHTALGDILLSNGRAREAVQHYESALALAPDFARAREGHAAAVARTR